MVLLGARGRRRARPGARGEQDVSSPRMQTRIRDKVVLRVVGKAVIPYVLLFGLYVQIHGDFGPGGGFQAGVIVAAGFILYALIFGLEALQNIVSETAIEIGITLGVALYAGVGVASLLLGGNFLDYDVLLHDPVHGQHLGIFLVELGVGITVWSVMLTIYYGFAGWKPTT